MVQREGHSEIVFLFLKKIGKKNLILEHGELFYKINLAYIFRLHGSSPV